MRIACILMEYNAFEAYLLILKEKKKKKTAKFEIFVCCKLEVALYELNILGGLFNMLQFCFS